MGSGSGFAAEAVAVGVDVDTRSGSNGAEHETEHSNGVRVPVSTRLAQCGYMDFCFDFAPALSLYISLQAIT